MSKRQRGNKEPKKPKQAAPPAKAPSTAISTAFDPKVAAPRLKRG